MREVTTDRDVIESIIRRAIVCRIAMSEEGQQDYPQATLKKTTVVRIDIQDATAKVSGY
jgi:hypothetical protein